LDRASAAVILNSTSTGRPEAILEGSVISATRTAASAALAARSLHVDEQVKSVAAIGCGLINFEIQRYLGAVFPTIEVIYVYDLKPERAVQFQQAIERTLKGVVTERVDDLGSALKASRLVSIATTAIDPYIGDLSGLAAGRTILHISLRDIMPEAILSCDNVVDDPDHVCQAQTSLHRAEQSLGHRRFIRCSLADVTTGVAPPRAAANSLTVFSPFGLGVLDIAVARLVRDSAVKESVGAEIDSFFPEPWPQRV
jgi:ornithine cyclodeaminase